jgi:hypothetical protein
MEKQSRMVVYGLEFQAAMRAAIAVAGSKAPWDLVQIAVTAGENVTVSARDGVENIMVESIVGAQMVDLGTEYDRVFEITRAAAREIAAMKMKQEEGEDDPLVGIVVSDRAVTRTDESGLGLGIRMARVRRHSYRGEPLALGEIGAMVTDAQSSASSETLMPAELTVTQIKKIAAVAAALGEKPIIQALGPTEVFRARTLVSFSTATVFAAIKGSNDDKRAHEHRTSDFHDEYVNQVRQALANPVGAV